MVNLLYDYTVFFKETPEPERLKWKVLHDSSDSDEFPQVMTDDQTHDDSSDSNISDEKEEVSSRSKEDQDRLRTANFSILRKQLFATDSQEDRASGRRAALVDRFIKDPKLGHKTCLLCGSSFTEKKSLYRHYRAKKPCRERVTEKPKKFKTRRSTTQANTGNLKSISIFLLMICYVNRLIHDCLIV